MIIIVVVVVVDIISITTTIETVLNVNLPRRLVSSSPSCGRLVAVAVIAIVV